MNTLTGCPYLPTRLMVSSWDRSPHSAANSTRNEAPTAARPVFEVVALAANSASVSASSSSAFGASRSSRIAPSRKITAATIFTTSSGRKVTACPTVTAMTVWIRKARPTPIHTKMPRYRVERTSAAMNVLSGSSTTKIAAKVRAMTERSTPETYSVGGGRPVAGQRGGGGEHVLHRAAELPGSCSDVLVLGLHVDQLAVEVGELHRDPLTVELDLGERAVQGVLGEGVLSDSDGRGLPEDLPAHSGRDLGSGEYREGVRRPALLHQDRGEPRVRRPDLKQRVQDVGPEPRI